jgi:hypothetical protein
VSGTDRSELAAAVIAAINSRDRERIAPLLHPDVEVRNPRNVFTGAERVLAWADKSYDHLDRRYAIAAARTRGDEVLILGDVEHLWREGGELGDSSPIAMTLTFEGDLLRSLRVDDDPAVALADFEA